MDGKKIVCPHCGKDVEVDVILQEIRSLELGIGLKVKNPPKEKKQKSKAKKN